MICVCVKEITEADFENEVLLSPTPVVVDFYSEGCTPCQMMSPVLEQLCTELQDTVKFVKVDVPANRKISIQHRIQSVPSFFIYRGGKVIAQSGGAQNKRHFTNWIQTALAS